MLTVLLSAFPMRSGRIRLPLRHAQLDFIFLTAKSMLTELKISEWKLARWLKLLLLKQRDKLNCPKSVPMHQPGSPSTFHPKRWDAAHLLKCKQVAIGGWDGADSRFEKDRWGCRWNRCLPSILVPRSHWMFRPREGTKKVRKKSFSLIATVYSAAALGINDKHLHHRVC